MNEPYGWPNVPWTVSRHLLLVHLHQREASLDERERLGAIVAAAPVGADLLSLATCHRVELYAALPRSPDPVEGLAGRLGSRDPALLGARVRLDGDAALHLLRVAAGLDSVIVGERQIVGQLRRTYDGARATGLDPILASLCQRALHLARTLRATTPLGAVQRTVGSLAVDEALRHVADPARVTALVVGAGEIGKLAARALASRVGRLVIANRDAGRAEALAADIGAETAPLDDLPRALDGADVLISAADTRGAVLTRDLLVRRGARRPLVLVDIAVPRSVAPDARELPGLTYRDVDHLAADGPGVGHDVVALAERRCADEAAAYVRWLHGRESAGTIRALRERADAVRERHLARALRHLGHLSERDRDVVGALAASLTSALIHEPTVHLRAGPDHVPAVRALFGLDDGRSE